MFVTSQPAAKWARALHRATAHNIIVTLAETVQDGYDVVEYWKARSVSRQDTIHGIRIECTAEGVDALCSCEGGQKELVCMHAAQALRAAGLLPDIMLIENPTPPMPPTADTAAGIALLMKTAA